MDDQEDISRQQSLLAMYRRSLALYLEQLAKQGGVFAPPGLLHNITEARENIRRLKESLRRQGVAVDDFSMDEAEQDTEELNGDLALQRVEPDESAEKSYLGWLANEIKNVSLQWHETPIVQTPAHRKRPLGWRETWRAALFRHDPTDYTQNPALSDSDLSIRAGFGRRVKIKNLAKELRKFSKIIVLGDPGSGKSVCLRQLAFDLAVRELGRKGLPRKLPVFVDMGTYDGWEDKNARRPTPILTFLTQQLRSHESVHEAPRTHPLLYMARNIERLLNEGRVTCIFDALDEMPQESYQERYQAIKNFMSAWEAKKNQFVYSCRSLDYDPSFNVDEVIIDPFDRKRIYSFLHQHVPHAAKILYRRIVEDESLEEMVSNPFFLQALAYINVPFQGANGDSTVPWFPTTRGELLRVFVDTLLIREAQEKQKEQLSSIEGGLTTLRRFLSELGFVLQERRAGGTSVRTDTLDDIQRRYSDWPQLLWIAHRARILGKRGELADQLADSLPPGFTPPERVEFVHHRLQEFFAAEELAQRLAQGEAVEQYLDDIWWQETVILTVGILRDPRAILQRMLAPQADANQWVGDVVAQAMRLPSPDTEQGG